MALAEGIVFRRDAGLGQCVEEGGLADVGPANDSAFKAHIELPVCCIGEIQLFTAKARRTRGGTGLLPCPAPLAQCAQKLNDGSV